VNAEQASHDEGLVKGSHHGDIETSPVASVSKVQAHLRDAARFRARSTSHAVAAHSSCTKIPLAAGRARVTLGGDGRAEHSRIDTIWGKLTRTRR
jgi:hypothetical protein